MAWENIHADDYGWIGKLRAVQDAAVVDISSYTTRQFIFLAPNGVPTTKTATFVTDGTDGLLQYTAEDGLIDAIGSWNVQIRISKSGSELTSNRHAFTVLDRLD